MLTQAPRGTKDVLPTESYKWHYLENSRREICARGGYREIRTPVFEHTELFLRGVGDTTDIVQKEMYTFLDKGERSVTLKPEGTAGVVRSFVENGLASQAQPTKMYYVTNPIFRYENPQAGRLREHHQFGVEVFGAKSASVDAEVISLALTLFSKLGIKGLTLHINSIGCPNCRPQYNALLNSYFTTKKEGLCETCLTRLDKNPLRILDCKEEKCKKIVADAPLMIDNLCSECADHFEELKSYLETLNILYEVDPFIVRGLDYYTKTVFEIISTSIGSQGTVCGGGRYDKLVLQIGGPEMPGIGFGLGLERLLLVLENEHIKIPEPRLYDVYFCTMGEEARRKAFLLVAELREVGFRADMDHCNRSLKAQFKYADKCAAPFVAVLGDDEIKAGVVKLRDMRTSTEQNIEFSQIKNWVEQEKCNG
ncbi:MAG: histidine--tRNA ligase [Eubacteriales bacterium]